MTMIDKVHGERHPGMVTGLRLEQVIMYLVVIATGLLLGAFIGLVVALFSGLITITC